jgi:NADPH:quinone reductase-like Zn-dependent oxidoreductase
VIDYTKDDFAKSGEHYDVMLDNVGTSHSLSDCRRVLNPDGKYVLVGGGSANDNKWIGTMGRPLKALLWSPFVSQKMGMMFADLNKKDLTTIAELIQAGKVTPVIDRRYKLSETADAMRYLEEGHARGKVIITME